MYRDVHGLNVYSGILFNHESPLRKDKFVTTKIINRFKSHFVERLNTLNWVI